MALPKLNKKPSAKEIDEQDDAVIESIEDSEEEIYEEEAPEIEEEVPETEESTFHPEDARAMSEEVLRDFFKTEQDVDENLIIDKKEEKIVPFGGRKTRKRKVKANELDNRRNKLTTRKLSRLLFWIVFLVLTATMVKSTFFPDDRYSQEEIAQIARDANGETGFPLERGATYSKEFLSTYLSYENGKRGRETILPKFYGGAMNDQSRVTGEVLQKVIDGPYVFDMYTIDSYTASYKLSVLVSDINGNAYDEKGNLLGEWLSFHINVYWDENTNSLAVDKNSPILIPNYEIASYSSTPAEAPLGNGSQESEYEEMIPTIDGFIEAYALVSLENSNAIRQYIVEGADPSVFSGFGGSVRLKDGVNSISKTVWKTDNENEWKIDIIVEWESVSQEPVEEAGSSQPSLTYKSRYIMTLEQTSDGKYLISRFLPYTYESR